MKIARAESVNLLQVSACLVVTVKKSVPKRLEIGWYREKR